MTTRAASSSEAETNKPTEPNAAAKPAAQTTSSKPPAGDGQSRQERAQHQIRKNTYWALGIGLVPFPLVDLAALTAVQVKMLRDIADIYGVSFSENKAKVAAASLITGLGSLTIGALVGRSLFKLVPVIGQAVSIVGVPLLAGALTTAVGNVFVSHFESGGTLADFDAAKAKEHFRKEFDTAKQSVKELKNNLGASSGAAPRSP